MPAEALAHRGVGEGLAEALPVDPPAPPKTVHATVTGWATAKHRPIVPAYLRSRNEARQLAGWLARHGAHVVGYQLSRTPVYGARLVVRAPAGLLVALVAVWRWVFDAEAAPLRADAVGRNAAAEYLSLSRQRNTRVRQRGLAAAAGLAVLLVAAVLVATVGPWWLATLAALVAVAVLGKLGTPPDRRVTDPATVAASAPPRLTADVVTRALQSLGIAAMSAKGATIGYVAPITRDGPGWRAEVDLPHGVTVADVVERRDRLASGLRRPLSSVWPEPAADQHAGRLVLWVGDQPLNAVKPAVWPLTKAGAVDLLGGVFPFGVDQRQRPVTISMAETNALIGSLPGGGKTSAVRVLALAAALDPHAEIRVAEHKGSGDLSALERVAHRYVSGPADEAIAATVESLRELHGELQRRAEVIATLPRQLVPDAKVTPELAGRRSLRLWPIVQIIDEAQEVFAHPEHGDEAGRLAEKIIKRGRALGIILVLATQRPDKDSLPTGVSANVGVRFCLRVMGQVENDMILGTSAYRNGVRATLLTPRDKGIGYLVGAADEPLVVRTYYVDRLAAERITERARVTREQAGTLTGYCVGDEPPLTPEASLLDDLRTIFATIEVDKVWSETVCERLAELRPEHYHGWGPEQLAAALRPYGIHTGQVWGRLPNGKGANRRGLTVADVLAAAERPQIGS
ncbi:FtsK/SpoIIIE domain-containing protein [Pseudonocardia hispaniensis]|uniref:FtsK/SpoIIIE domain-containing protein n=1 Tax=Pseudonocardia hispaniensis TaxID=904933 RepID=A0ABW1J5X8_9PSEU